MDKFISSAFFHELKNSFSSVKFSLQMVEKYEMTKEEKKQTISDVLKTIDNTTQILEEYMEFMKFKFTKKLKYENISLNSILEEIKVELTPFIKEKKINIYLPKTDIELLTNKFWLKRAIYNVLYNAVKYNEIAGTINIKIEKDIFGIYLSISDTGVGINQKSLSTIFKMFHQIDETKSGFGIGLALAKAVITSFGGKINVKTNENIGTEFILYIPKKPKEVTIKKIAFGLIPASILLILGIGYFPILPQSYIKIESSKYIVYKLEDGSVLKFTKNSNYELKAYKNLYNTKFRLNSSLYDGDMSLKAIKNKASIMVDNREFNNLGTDFEIIKDNETKLAVFQGKVKNNQTVLNKGEGGIFGKTIKTITLLPAVKSATIKNNILSFRPQPKAAKYKIIISLNKEFSDIQNTLFSTKNKINLTFEDDTLYYIKIFSYDKYGLPSMPKVIKYVSLNHYTKGLSLLKDKPKRSMIEFINSASTIHNYSSLPYYELAKIYFDKKDYKKSLYYINKALNIKEDKKYYYVLFDDNFKLNKFEFNKLNKLLVTYPNDMKFLYYKALKMYKDKEYKKASRLLFRVLQQNPDLKEANLLMSKVLFRLGKMEESKYYKRAAK